MKICLVCDYTAPAKDSMGAERMIEALAAGFQELGHEVVMKINPDSIDAPAPVVSEIPEDCDIINFNGWDPDTSPEQFSSYGKPWVVTLHGGGSEASPLWLQTVKNPHMICVSKFVADRIGTKAYAWSCSSPDDLMFLNEEEPKKDYFLWMAGTDWGEGKGLWTTIALAKKLKFKLKIAGAGSHHGVINEIKRHCDDRIEFVGAVNGEEKAKLLAYAKGFLLLTRLPDACPLTFSEAMLSGTPVITLPNGAMPELMNEKVGFICSNENELAKAIIKIDTIKPGDCYDYGMENFSNIATAKKYLQFYQNMIDFGNVQGEQQNG
jgi:glycosyltransferase involved in cell wall biosynthesis